MGRKKHKENTQVAKKKEEREVSPFEGIVLKEKKEEPKKVQPKKIEKSGKHPSEIVQGYNPNSSFADILFAFEHTGNPYAMPESKKKQIASKKTDFGSILDQWEGKGTAKKKAPAAEKKAEYKPTKSFGDILASYEGTAPVKKRDEKPTIIEESLGKPENKSFFKDEDDDWKRDPNAAWSVLGKNDSYVRPEPVKHPEAKKDSTSMPSHKRASSPYKASKDFSEILMSFEGKKAAVKKAEEPSLKKEPAVVKKEEPVEVPLSDKGFFRDEDEDYKRDPKASWSVLGNNDSFVRPEPVKEIQLEEKKEKPKKKEKKKKAPSYKATKDFSEILVSYDKQYAKPVEEAPKVEEPKFDPAISETLFKTEDEDNKRAPNASWSVLGNNESFVRKEEEKVTLPPIEPVVERVSEPYEPTKEFSAILNDYEKGGKANGVSWSFNGSSVNYDKSKNTHKIKVEPEVKEAVKTFEEILAEKGDLEKKKPTYTISQLRTMPPQAALDLHGETALTAETLVRDFLQECLENGIRKISIITGKGLHSEDGVGIMREITERVLEESGMVSEKNNAPMNAGGSGALWIILKA